MKKQLFLLALALIALLPLQAQEKITVVPDEPIYTVVENDPQFPGGMDALYDYLARNAHYPEKAKEEGIQGTVYVTFIVERDGDISNIKILRSPSDELSNEARRLIKAMPKWKPGTHRGKPVRVQFNLPISFQLD